MKETETWALLAADTDRTQDYVFESARLPEIRGASQQLDALNRRLGDEVTSCGGKVIFAGGGGLLAWVPVDAAPALCLKIESLYPRETTVATITADWRPVTPEMRAKGYPENPDAPFGSLMHWAGTWLRRRKESKQRYPFVEAPPYADRCSSCQIRPAVKVLDPMWALCQICYQKRIYSERAYWFERFQKHYLSSDSSYYAGQPAFPSLNNRTVGRWTPQDLSEIGEACRARSGYVGFIYLDGDEMGQVFQSLPTEAAYRVFSRKTQEAAEVAVMEALACLHPAWVTPSDRRYEIGEKPQPVQLNAQGKMRIHPFEIITIGGDDVILIVPADQAIRVACEISQGFQEKMRLFLSQEADIPAALKERPYTMSGGVVLASDHNPVRVLRDLAVELKESAKRSRKRARQEAQQEGHIDFLVLKSADMVEQTVAQMRLRYPYRLTETSGGRPLCLLGRPYAISVLVKLWKGLVDLRRGPRGEFPNSQMMQLAQSLLQGRREATLFYLYQRARDTEGYFVRLDEVLLAAQGGTVADPIPWIGCNNSDFSYQTALWDIAELYAFVGGRYD